MKYFTVNNNDLSISEVFNDLKEIRTQYSNIDVTDFIDDLDVNHQGKLFISESYLTTMLKQTKEEENTSSLRDMISLKEDLDEMKEQYKQANIEIETVHGEYVKVLESDNKNKETITAHEKRISELEDTKVSLEKSIKEANDTLDVLVKENQTKLDNIKSIMISSQLKDIEKEFKALDTVLSEIEAEVNNYKGVN